MKKPAVKLTTFDKRLMQIVPDNARHAVDIVNKALKAGLIDGVNVFEFRSQSVEFLAHLLPMQRVNFQICRDIDTSPLHGQKSLRRLVSSSEAVELDVSHFPRLQSFSGFWHRRSKGLDTLKHLEKASLWQLDQRYPDIASLGFSRTLRQLTITQSRIRSTAGVEQLPKLERLELNYLREKVDLAPIGKSKSIRELEIESVRNYINLPAVSGCPKLNYIQIEKGAPIASIKWLKKMPQLTGFLATQTQVKDRDFSVIANLKKLIYFAADNKREYRPAIDELEALVEARYDRAEARWKREEKSWSMKQSGG
jgi:hypothetical protein